MSPHGKKLHAQGETYILVKQKRFLPRGEVVPWQ